jgi:hypothetical protein
MQWPASTSVQRPIYEAVQSMRCAEPEPVNTRTRAIELNGWSVVGERNRLSGPIAMLDSWGCAIPRPSGAPSESSIRRATASVSSGSRSPACSRGVRSIRFAGARTASAAAQFGSVARNTPSPVINTGRSSSASSSRDVPSNESIGAPAGAVSVMRS